MTLVKNKPEGLLYIQEHVECKNYLTGNDALFEEINLESGELFIREFVNRPSLLFILSGEIKVSIRHFLEYVSIITKRNHTFMMLSFLSGILFPLV
jgi:hypothetical protein